MKHDVVGLVFRAAHIPTIDPARAHPSNYTASNFENTLQLLRVKASGLFGYWRCWRGRRLVGQWTG